MHLQVLCRTAFDFHRVYQISLILCTSIAVNRSYLQIDCFWERWL